jgi:hypothetical protein
MRYRTIITLVILGPRGIVRILSLFLFIIFILVLLLPTP